VAVCIPSNPQDSVDALRYGVVLEGGYPPDDGTYTPTAPSVTPKVACDYCTSPNPVERTHCSQCGAPLPL